MSSNKNLADATRVKDDEFYTTIETIEKELRNYDWTGKKVFCPCDYENSNFISYFRRLGVDVRFRRNPFPVRLDLFGDPIKDQTFETDAEYWDGVNWSDVVVTNPPFSKIASFLKTLIASGKRFLFLGPALLITTNYCFDVYRKGGFRFGCNNNRSVPFGRPDGSVESAPVSWYTNLPPGASVPFVPRRQLSASDLADRDAFLFVDRYRLFGESVLFLTSLDEYPVDYWGPVAVPADGLYKLERDGRFIVWDKIKPFVNRQGKFERVIVTKKPDC